MATETMQDLLADELKDLYSAENQILKALPRMIKAAEADELRQALQQHAEVTQTHVQRLERAAEIMGVRPKGKKCVGMEGVLEEGKEALEHEGEVLDAALIAAAQKVEHYEIAGYGTARAHAQALGLDEAADLFQQTLDEEKQADQTLTELAEDFVNQLAAAEDDEDDEQAEDDEDDDMEALDEDEDEEAEDEQETERDQGVTRSQGETNSSRSGSAR